MMVATAATSTALGRGLSRGTGGICVGGGRIWELIVAYIKIDQGVRKGGLRYNGQNNLYSHVETSGARWGAFFGFSRPTSSRFSQIFVSNQFWRIAGAFSKMAIFFKLQAGVSLVSSVTPPCPCRTTPPRRAGYLLGFPTLLCVGPNSGQYQGPRM